MSESEKVRLGMEMLLLKMSWYQSASTLWSWPRSMKNCESSAPNV